MVSYSSCTNSGCNEKLQGMSVLIFEIMAWSPAEVSQKPPLWCIITQLGVLWGFTSLPEAFCVGQMMRVRWMGHCSALKCNSVLLCLKEANHGWGLMRQKERISTLGNCLFRVTFSYLSTSLLPEILSDWILAEQREMLLFYPGRVEGRAINRRPQ